MKFIKENDKLAFEYKSEKIYLDDFLKVILDTSKGSFTIKDNDGKTIANYSYRPITNLENLLPVFLSNYLIDQVSIKRHLSDAILLSNYTEQFVKLLKAYLKYCYIGRINSAQTEDDANYEFSEFKNFIDILNSELERAKQVKKDHLKLVNLKKSKIAEIENLM